MTHPTCDSWARAFLGWLLVLVNVKFEGATLTHIFFLPTQVKNLLLTTVMTWAHGISSRVLTGKSLLALINQGWWREPFFPTWLPDE